LKQGASCGGTISDVLGYEKSMGPKALASYIEMKPLNLKAALILITIGTILLIVSVIQYQSGEMICTLTADLCAQVAAHASQEAVTQFFEFTLFGLASMGLAVVFLISGRNQGSSPPSRSS